MMSTIKTGRPATKRHAVYFAGLVAIVAGALASVPGVQLRPMDSAAQARADGDYAQGWGAVEATGDAGKFVATNYRSCIEARDTGYTMTDWWLVVTHSRENTAEQCGQKTVSLASARGDAFATQVKNVIASLPSQLALPVQQARTFRWFVIEDRPG